MMEPKQANATSKLQMSINRAFRMPLEWLAAVADRIFIDMGMAKLGSNGGADSENLLVNLLLRL